MAIIKAINTKDCNGWECGSLPSFDVISIEGEGRVADRDLPKPTSIPLARVLVQNVPAQWAALITSIIFETKAPDGTSKGLLSTAQLQDRQCLYCLLMSAVREFTPTCPAAAWGGMSAFLLQRPHD